MRKYETVVRIVTYGEDAYEAGEKAGRLIDISGMEDDTTISCEPTEELMEREASLEIERRLNSIFRTKMTVCGI